MVPIARGATLPRVCQIILPEIRTFDFSSLFCPIFKWSDHVIWWTIWIPDILDHKKTFLAQFLDHHSKSGPFDNLTCSDHSNTRLVRYSDGYCTWCLKHLPVPNARRNALQICSYLVKSSFGFGGGCRWPITPSLPLPKLLIGLINFKIFKESFDDFLCIFWWKITICATYFDTQILKRLNIKYGRICLLARRIYANPVNLGGFVC